MFVTKNCLQIDILFETIPREYFRGRLLPNGEAEAVLEFVLGTATPVDPADADAADKSLSKEENLLVCFIPDP